MKIITFLLGLMLWAQGSSSAALDETTQIIHRKFSKAAEKVPLDANHPALRAAALIEDKATQDTAVKLCHVFQRDLNLVIGWLKHEANPDSIMESWSKPENRPMIEAGELWCQETISIKKLADYLKPTAEGRKWHGTPLVIADDYHVVVLNLREDLPHAKVYADFYDGYEPFERGSFLERRVLEVLEYQVYAGEEAPQVEWTPHYLKHQKLTAFGECSLYAAVYRSLLLKGLKPEGLSQEDIHARVSVLKEIMQENHPQYFYEYDRVFSFAFDSGFAGHLLTEIKKLPADWGIEPEEEPPV